MVCYRLTPSLFFFSHTYLIRMQMSLLSFLEVFIYTELLLCPMFEDVIDSCSGWISIEEITLVTGLPLGLCKQS